MPPRNTLARKPDAIELDIAEAKLTEVYRDPDPADGDSEFEDREDDDPMHMIEHSLGETCDCGNRVFSFNRCTNCGAQAPWASKLGCGSA